MHIRKCAYCGSTFTASRSDARFCKDACRVGMNTLPERMKTKADHAIDYLAQMRELAEKFPQLSPALDEQLARVAAKLAEVRDSSIS